MSKILKCMGLLLPLSAVMLTSCKGESVELRKYKNEVTEAEFFKAYEESKKDIIKTTTNEDYRLVMTSTHSVKNSIKTGTEAMDQTQEVIREVSYDSDNMALEFRNSYTLTKFGNQKNHFDVMFTGTQSEQNISLSAYGTNNDEKINQYNTYVGDLQSLAKSYLSTAVYNCKTLPSVNEYFKYYVDKNVFTMVMEYTGSEPLTNNKLPKKAINQVVIKDDMISEYQYAEFKYTSNSVSYEETTLGTLYIELTNTKVKKVTNAIAIESKELYLPVSISLT